MSCCTRTSLIVKLKIWNFVVGRLEKLPPWIHSFKSLRKLYIENCPRLISLPDAVIYKSLCLEELKIFECGSLISIGRHQLPTTLKRLEIRNCYGLLRLLDARETCSSSRFTDKEGISCDAYSSNLQHLGIIRCLSLTFLGELPVFDNNTSLESIEIVCALDLKSLPENLHMLTNLRRIVIYQCEGLEALPDGMHNLTSLQELTIMDCPNVVSFPQGGLPTTHLKEIILESCGKLEALPDNMHNLTSLEVLSMQDCPGIMSFPEEGFPTNLKSLSIYEVEICTSLFNWGLHRLTSLEKLTIAGGCPGVVSFPQDEIDMKLSNSLTSLTIEGFQDLKCLSSKGFQSLTSLEYLISAFALEFSTALLCLCTADSLFLVVVAAALAAEAEVAEEVEGREGGYVATATVAPPKPKKGKAALPLKRTG
ncbi:hypothetical protein GH714_018216 [Hevea brasiliensis]|uniref:Uncharacterized protein n=1 Tax=Hevea brasiliensis TaxID=3981 RepID=A0A6A6N215_HEVBR|nr:hypothetical protein GH714_018216 [Hevea brasiliensis]